jgi:hypothetical protein
MSTESERKLQQSRVAEKRDSLAVVEQEIPDFSAGPPSMEPYFEPVPPSVSCDYCTGRRALTPLPEPLDAIYCISLQDQPHRTRQTAAHFHHIGLCRHVTLYRPVRGKNGERAIWESHRALARHALAKGRRNALMLEDDVFFRQPWDRLAPRIARVMAALPADWWCLYLGHVPYQAYFIRPNILRVRSACAHAYIAGPRLLAWLVDTEPFSPEIARRGTIVGAMFDLPGMYALFPMAALQRFLGDYRVDPRGDRIGRPRRLLDGDRWRYYVIFRGALVMEALSAMLSPFHWLALERNRKGSEFAARRAVGLIRTTGLFDVDYYLRSRPDVAASEMPPLSHYLDHGAAEGTWPCPLFDPGYYAAQSPELGRENPLIHYIQAGTALGRKPHPLFDTAFYLSRYAERIPSGMHPLAHYLSLGVIAGFDPHPLFDSAWYLSRHPQVRERRQNPLVHYLTEGWRDGAAPHPQFDGELYLSQNPDVKAAGVNPLEHFVRHGQAEGRAQPLPPAHAP